MRVETLAGAKGGRPAAGTHGGRNEESYRGTDVVCGKSVHIIRVVIGKRRFRQDWRGGVGEANALEMRTSGGVVGEGGYYLRDATRTRTSRAYRGKPVGGRREDRKATLKGKYEVWKFGLGPFVGREGGGARGTHPSMFPFRSFGDRSMCGRCERGFPALTADIKLLRRGDRGSG